MLDIQRRLLQLNDIIITIPRFECEDWLFDIEQAAKVEHDLLYHVSRLPIRPVCGSRCYVVCEGKIVGYHIIKSLENVEGRFKCVFSGKRYPFGRYIVRGSTTWHALAQNVPLKGFCGYRYLDELPDIAKALGR